jgi:peptidoglycan/xylan/chitin deacetylase (PgdA/CDA1 family)
MGMTSVLVRRAAPRSEGANTVPSRGDGLRRRFKSGLARGLSWAGADGWSATLRGVAKQPLIVGYHRVIADGAEALGLPGMVIQRATLERHLDWIGRRFRFASLDEIGARLEAGESARGLAAITFDDGYNDVYENAFPLLSRKGVPGAVFVVTDVIGSPDPPLFERLYLVLRRAFSRWEKPASGLTGRLLLYGITPPEPSAFASPDAATQALLGRLQLSDLRDLVECLERELGHDRAWPLRPMTWDALARMSRAGFVIGSHTRSHALLTLEWTPSALGEVGGSRAVLEARLGQPVRHFAYPDGRWNARATTHVAEAGYRFAYTICGHRHEGQPLLTIPRRMLWEGSCRDAAGGFSDAVLSCHVRGVFDLVSPCRRRHSWAPWTE